MGFLGFGDSGHDDTLPIEPTPARPRLVATDLDYHVEGPPNRRFVLEFKLDTDSEDPLLIVRSWASFRLMNRAIAEGDFLHTHTKGVHRLITPESGAGCDLHIPLTRETIEMVEDRREGDVDFHARIPVVAIPYRDGLISGMEKPWDLWIRNEKNDTKITGTVPQSEWHELLKQLGREESQLIELPAARLRQKVPGAFVEYEEAVQHYRRGEYRQTLASCHKAMEAVAWARTRTGKKQVEMKKIRGYFPDNEKGNHLDALTTSLNSFLHTGRHQQPEHKGIEVTKQDGIFALNAVAGILRYIAS